RRRCADRPVGQVDQHCETFVTTPRIAKPEQRQRVQEGMCPRLEISRVINLQDEGKDTAGTLEIALPYRVAWKTRQCRVQDPCNIVTAFQPACDLQPALLVMVKAHAHCPQPSEDLVGIVRCAA